MVDPLSNPIRPSGLTPTPGAAPVSPTGDAEGADFAQLMRTQLEKVSAMQNEADAGLQKVLTGESDNMTDVFVAARKAEVAFSLLMEVRNQLVEAYDELRQLRV